MKIEENIYLTKWAKEPIPFGAFQDYIIFESSLNNQFVMHKLELDFITKKLHTLFFEQRKIKYIQIFEEWHECTGFNDIYDCVSILKDVTDTTIEALSCITDVISDDYGDLHPKDLEALIRFLIENQSGIISFRQE